MTKHHFYLLHRLRLKTVHKIAMVVLLFGSLTVIGIVNKQPIAHAFTLATTHQPERYSELYFANHTHLPLSTPALKAHAIAFHITNHEGKAVSYQYLTSMTIDNRTTLLSVGSILLQDSQGADTTFNFQLPKPGVKAVINVSLVGRNEHIDFRTHS